MAYGKLFKVFDDVVLAQQSKRLYSTNFSTCSFVYGKGRHDAQTSPSRAGIGGWEFRNETKFGIKAVQNHIFIELFA